MPTEPTVRDLLAKARTCNDPILIIADEHNGRGPARIVGFVLRVLTNDRGEVAVLHDSLPAPKAAPSGGLRTVALSTITEVIPLVPLRPSAATPAAKAPAPPTGKAVKRPGRV